MLDYFIFFACGIVAIASAVLVIIQKNPVASVIFLIMAFFAQAILYIQLSALFVAVLQIIVYTGAIMVLFLFVIMLLNLGRDEFGQEKSSTQKWFAWIFGVVLLAELPLAIIKGYFGGQGDTIASPAGFGSVEQVGTILFTKYVFAFELTSILLIVAIVGAVVLAKKRTEERQ